MNIEEFKLPVRTKNILIRKYPNKLSRNEKIEIANKFFQIYKSKLINNILKNENQSFREINRMTLISLVDYKTNFKKEYFKYIKDKDLIMIGKTIEESLILILENGEMKITENIFLKERDKKVVFKNNKNRL